MKWRERKDRDRQTCKQTNGAQDVTNYGEMNTHVNSEILLFVFLLTIDVTFVLFKM